MVCLPAFPSNDTKKIKATEKTKQKQKQNKKQNKTKKKQI